MDLLIRVYSRKIVGLDSVLRDFDRFSTIEMHVIGYLHPASVVDRRRFSFRQISPTMDGLKMWLVLNLIKLIPYPLLQQIYPTTFKNISFMWHKI